MDLKEREREREREREGERDHTSSSGPSTFKADNFSRLPATCGDAAMEHNNPP